MSVIYLILFKETKLYIHPLTRKKENEFHYSYFFLLENLFLPYYVLAFNKQSILFIFKIIK
jgi:hypothetical protein